MRPGPIQVVTNSIIPGYDIDVNFDFGGWMTSRPIAEGLFTDGPEPRLLAGRCGSCGLVTFPQQVGCPRCTGQNVARHELPAEGRLWTWTVQRFEPKPPYRGPDVFEPYGVGYVEFPGECIVEGRLTTTDPSWLEIGASMRMTLVEAFREADDTVVTTYAFAPVGGSA
jgi:uncharacterized protein